MMTLVPMLVSRVWKLALIWGPLGCAGLALAADEVQPDLEFLEYLGSWEESDKDWLMFAEVIDRQVADDDPKQPETVPHNEESTELEDES
jgi:hypothetical protein